MSAMELGGQVDGLMDEFLKATVDIFASMLDIPSLVSQTYLFSPD
jgi:hypothetical protein